jgi:hypothetical protein
MSQRYDAMNAVKKLSTVGDLIVRPLCQKLLPDTLPIREGWVNKDDLLNLSGRSRKPQIKLAEEMGLKDLPQSGGGCLLTDWGYTKRLKELIDHGGLDLQKIKFLKVGRHFRISPLRSEIATAFQKCSLLPSEEEQSFAMTISPPPTPPHSASSMREAVKLITNRHLNEMEYLMSIIKNETIIKHTEIPGPIGIIDAEMPISEEILKIAGGIVLRYSNKAGDVEVLNYGEQFNLIHQIECRRLSDSEIDKYRIN